MEKLTIITACSRPETLFDLAKSIEPGRGLFDLDWIVVFDTGKIKPIDVAGARIAGVYDPESTAGNAQKNYGLEMVQSGWVYFLDDDNIIHPDFFPGLANLLEQIPDARGVLMAQDLGMGMRNVYVPWVQVNEIDLGQMVVKRDLIGERRFSTARYQSDGMMIMSLFWGNLDSFGLSNQPMAYYNRLRWEDEKRCPVPIYQDHMELDELRKAVRALKPEKILEIGSMYGGTLWCWMQDLPGAKIVSVDLMVGPEDARHESVVQARQQWSGWAREAGCNLVQLVMDSTDDDTVQDVEARAPYDFIFIDGGHDYATVKADFEHYWPMLREGGLMAFHDIAYPDGNPHGYEVGRLYREIADQGRCQEIRRYLTDTWGIGLLWKES